MKKYLSYFSLLLLTIVISETSAQLKRPEIILYDDGTWSKVEASSTEKTATIEETWKQFQQAIKSKDKNKISEFFDFPFEIDVLNNHMTEGKLNKFLPLKGSITNKKLNDNINIIFDNNISQEIQKIESGEYLKEFSDKRKQPNYSFRFNYFESSADNGKTRTHLYEIYFVQVNNKFKIYLIAIGYTK
jgi:hypothetical protein